VNSIHYDNFLGFFDTPNHYINSIISGVKKLEIKEAIELIWENRKYKTQDLRTALSHLNEEVAESLKALMRGEDEKAKKELEDALSCLFIAFKVMDIDIEEAIHRQIERMNSKFERIMVISDKKAEIFVNGDQKGSWSIWGNEDMEDAKKIAKEFGCEIIWSNGEQESKEEDSE
jgi:NTP pyrophosphatase (non-canonical NTP hydrolase)